MVTARPHPRGEGALPTDAPGLVALSLMGIGLLAVYSAAAWGRDGRVGPGDGLDHLLAQGGAAAAAIALALALRRCDPAWLRRAAPWGALLSLGLLAVLLFPGMPRINNAQRWIILGPATFQPSEFAKLALIVFLADALDRRSRGEGGATPLLLGVPALHVLLIALEPDLGTAVFAGVLSLLLLLLGGVSLRLLALASAAVVLPAAAVVLSGGAPHVVDRLRAFGDPHDPARSHQVWQSLLALGRGGLLGEGLGGSVQKLAYLPYGDCDFVLAVLGEELGLAGTLSVVALFGAFTLLGVRTVRRAAGRFEALLAAGCTFTIGLQAAMNIAVVTASIPPKGIPLPFLSKGGSSMLSSAAAVGILLGVGRAACKAREGS